MVKLKRLKILKYRNVRPGTELHFDDGVNLVLGQNASGKTTLLALISAVCRGDFSDLRDEEYDLEVDAARDNITTTLHITQSHSHVDDVSAQPIPKKSWDRTVTWASAPPMTPAPLPDSWASNLYLRYDIEGDLVVWSGLDEAYRFDESLEAFAAATGRSMEIEGPGVPVPALARTLEPEPGDIYFDWDYVPTCIRSLLEGQASDPVFRRAISAAEHGLCRDIAQALAVRDVMLKPNFEERRVRQDSITFRVRGFTFEVERPDGTIIHHDRLSYGQKRLLAFFYYLACNPAVVIADELVNGLHHRWIEACMKALGDRQAFLTSQNPLLFDYVEFDSVEQVRSRFITCRLEQVDGRERMVWENMPEDDARRFFEAYEAGIEHVGDILITRGMW